MHGSIILIYSQCYSSIFINTSKVSIPQTETTKTLTIIQDLFTILPDTWAYRALEKQKKQRRKGFGYSLLTTLRVCLHTCGLYYFVLLHGVYSCDEILKNLSLLLSDLTLVYRPQLSSVTPPTTENLSPACPSFWEE